MDVWRITVAALRRWYVFLPLLALTAFGAYTVGAGVKPQYEVAATAILVPGSGSSEIESPYGSLDTTATVLEIIVDDATTRASIGEQGLQSDYEFGARSRSRIMDLRVLSDSPELSLATGEAVIEWASHELSERQTAVGIPPEAQVGLQVLQAPAVIEVVTEGKMRNMAVIGILGGGLSLLVAVLFDDLLGLLKRWQRQSQERKAARASSATTLGHGEGEVAASPQPEGPSSSTDKGSATLSGESQPDSLSAGGRRTSLPGEAAPAGKARRGARVPTSR